MMADTITVQPAPASALNEIDERAPVRPPRTHRSKKPIPQPRLERKEETSLCRLLCSPCIECEDVKCWYRRNDSIDLNQTADDSEGGFRESDNGPMLLINEDTGYMHVTGVDRYIDDLDCKGISGSYRPHGDDNCTPMGHDIDRDAAPVYIDCVESHQTSNGSGHYVNVDHKVSGDQLGSSFHERATGFCDSSDATGSAHHGVSDTSGAGHCDSGGVDGGVYSGADDKGGGGGCDSGGGGCDSGGGGGDSGGGDYGGGGGWDN